jgi:hypothetical protein
MFLIELFGKAIIERPVAVQCLPQITVSPTS